MRDPRTQAVRVIITVIFCYNCSTPKRTDKILPLPFPLVPKMKLVRHVQGGGGGGPCCQCVAGCPHWLSSPTLVADVSRLDAATLSSLQHGMCYRDRSGWSRRVLRDTALGAVPSTLKGAPSRPANLPSLGGSTDHRSSAYLGRMVHTGRASDGLARGGACARGCGGGRGAQVMQVIAA